MPATIKIQGYESMVNVCPDGSMAQGFVLITDPVSFAVLPEDGYVWERIAEAAARALTRLLAA